MSCLPVARRSPGVKLVANAEYPTIAQDFQRTFRVQKGLPCDVFLAAHASQFDGNEKMTKTTFISRISQR